MYSSESRHNSEQTSIQVRVRYDTRICVADNAILCFCTHQGSLFDARARVAFEGGGVAVFRSGMLELRDRRMSAEAVSSVGIVSQAQRVHPAREPRKIGSGKGKLTTRGYRLVIIHRWRGRG
jgi:hypothetical protein